MIDPEILFDTFAIGAAALAAVIAVTFGIFRHERPLHIARTA